LPTPEQGSPNTLLLAAIDNELLLIACSTFAAELLAWHDPI
jgi:hypothetical protein